MELREVSVMTGRSMYAGQARPGGTANRTAMQSIVILGLLGSVGVLLVVVRPGSRAVTVPAGVRRAEPMRRLAAAVIDYVPSAIVVALAQGRSALVLLTPWTMLGGGGVTLGEMDLVPAGIAIGLTIVHTGVCEWLLGRSFGKFVMGLRVVSVADGAVGGRPRLWQAMTRSVLRWIVPLLAAFAMLDEHGRHPGDLAARTLVEPSENDGR